MGVPTTQAADPLWYKNNCYGTVTFDREKHKMVMVVAYFLLNFKIKFTWLLKFILPLTTYLEILKVRKMLVIYNALTWEK